MGASAPCTPFKSTALQRIPAVAPEVLWGANLIRGEACGKFFNALTALQLRLSITLDMFVAAC